MSKKSIEFHMGYLKKDFIGEINFVCSKVLDVALDLTTSFWSRLKCRMGGGKKDWQGA